MIFDRSALGPLIPGLCPPPSPLLSPNWRSPPPRWSREPIASTLRKGRPLRSSSRISIIKRPPLDVASVVIMSSTTFNERTSGFFFQRWRGGGRSKKTDMHQELSSHSSCPPYGVVSQNMVTFSTPMKRHVTTHPWARAAKWGPERNKGLYDITTTTSKRLTSEYRRGLPSDGSSLFALLPCFELLCTNILSEMDKRGPSTLICDEITTWNIKIGNINNKKKTTATRCPRLFNKL